MARIGHIEIAGTDGGMLGDFYSELFGWTITRRDVGGFDYYDIDTGSTDDASAGPTAGIRHEPEGRAEIVVYVEVDDLDATFEKAKNLGVEVRIPPMDYGDLSFALVEDPAGNPLGLTQVPATVSSAASL